MNALHEQSGAISGLRKAALLARRSMTVEQRDNASSIITDRLTRRHEFTAAKSIGCYLSMHDEVDTAHIILRAWRAKKRIFCPVTDFQGHMTFYPFRPESLLRRNNFGIWEPVDGETIDASDLDIVITPLAAFDAEHNRIGMGGGYFDRTFAFLKHRRHWRRPKLIGVAFDCQKVEKIAPNPWDIRLYDVISEFV